MMRHLLTTVSACVLAIFLIGCSTEPIPHEPMHVAAGAETVAFDAAYRGDFETVKKRVEEDPGLLKAYDGTFYYDPTLMHIAARWGEVDLILFLISKGGDVNLSMDEWWTPLHEAAEGGHLDAIAVLLAHGAKVNAGRGEGTPLHAAATAGQGAAVEALLAAGADLNAKNTAGWTASGAAWDAHHEELAQFLEELPAHEWPKIVNISFAAFLERLNGIQLSGFTMVQRLNGLQVCVGGGAMRLHGCQLMGLVAHASQLSGLQAGASALVSEKMQGVQVGGLGSGAAEVNGVQIAPLVCSAEQDMNGVQLAGLYCQAKLARGLQLGLVNNCEELSGVQIGLLNISKNHWLPYFPLINVRLGHAHKAE